MPARWSNCKTGITSPWSRQSARSASGAGAYYYIDVAHDVAQAMPGGLVNETLQYSPTSNVLTGGTPGFFPGTRPFFFIVEAGP